MRVACTWWGTFLPNLGTLGLWGSRIIRYVCDGWTYRQTDKSNAYCPLPYGAGHKKDKRANSCIISCSPAYLCVYVKEH